MKQSILNVTIDRDIHRRGNGEIGVLTCIRTEKRLPDGRTVPYRSSCSYEIKKSGSVISQLRHFRKQFQTKGRRAA